MNEACTAARLERWSFARNSNKNFERKNPERRESVSPWPVSTKQRYSSVIQPERSTPTNCNSTSSASWLTVVSLSSFSLGLQKKKPKLVLFQAFCFS